jgi:hypothetical protein
VNIVRYKKMGEAREDVTGRGKRDWDVQGCVNLYRGRHWKRQVGLGCAELCVNLF